MRIRGHSAALSVRRNVVVMCPLQQVLTWSLQNDRVVPLRLPPSPPLPLSLIVVCALAPCPALLPVVVVAVAVPPAPPQPARHVKTSLPPCKERRTNIPDVLCCLAVIGLVHLIAPDSGIGLVARYVVVGAERVSNMRSVLVEGHFKDMCDCAMD